MYTEGKKREFQSKFGILDFLLFCCSVHLWSVHLNMASLSSTENQVFPVLERLFLHSVHLTNSLFPILKRLYLSALHFLWVCKFQIVFCQSHPGGTVNFHCGGVSMCEGEYLYDQMLSTTSGIPLAP